MRSRLALAMVFGLGACAADAENLCPAPDNSAPAEGTRMTEDTFEAPAGLDAADKLQTYLNQENLTYDFGQVVNSFVAKGVILRQQALMGRTAVELAKARQAKPEDIAKAEAEAKRNLEAFCAFMVNAVVAE
jgi:hypothetical protein